MEESNQFLEENAITYDTEADEKVIPEKEEIHICGIYRYSSGCNRGTIDRK